MTACPPPPDYSLWLIGILWTCAFIGFVLEKIDLAKKHMKVKP